MPKQQTKSGTPAPRRKRRSSEEVADLILEAAAAEFSESGYSGATTAAIAKRASVTEAQIFRFYGSKQELFRAAIFQPLNRHFSEFRSRMIGDAQAVGTLREQAEAYIRELQDLIEDNSRMLMSLIVASAYSPEATGGPNEIEGLREYFARGTAMMASRQSRDATVSPRLMVRVSFAAVLASVMFRDWLFPADIGSDEEIREAIVDFVIDGIRATDKDIV